MRPLEYGEKDSVASGRANDALTRVKLTTEASPWNARLTGLRRVAK
jgi:hypothetical protein